MWFDIPFSLLFKKLYHVVLSNWPRCSLSKAQLQQCIWWLSYFLEGHFGKVKILHVSLTAFSEKREFSQKKISHTGLSCTSSPPCLALLFPLPGILFPRNAIWLQLTSVSSFLKYFHLFEFFLAIYLKLNLTPHRDLCMHLHCLFFSKTLIVIWSGICIINFYISFSGH